MSRVLFKQMPNRPALNHALLRRRLTAGLLALGLTAGEFVHATGESLPLNLFWKKNLVLMEIDQKQIADSRLTRQLFLEGRAVQEKPVPIAAKGIARNDGSNVVELTDWYEPLYGLNDGAYSEKVSVELVRRDQDREHQAMRYDYWFHYLVSGGRPKPLSAREYEDLTSPIHYEVDVKGLKQPHKTGLDLAFEISPPEGKKAIDVPVKTEQTVKQYSLKRDLSEKEER